MELLNCTRNGTAITAKPTPDPAIALSTVDGAGTMPAIWVYNPTSQLMRVKMGASDVVAGATSVPVPPGEFQAFAKGSATHISAWTATGTAAGELFAGAER